MCTLSLLSTRTSGTDKKKNSRRIEQAAYTLQGASRLLSARLKTGCPNAKYTGEFMHGQRLCANTYPVIIDKATFAKVQKGYSKTKYFAGANSAIEPYLLYGQSVLRTLRHGYDSGRRNKQIRQKHYYYVCKQKIKRTLRQETRGQRQTGIVRYPSGTIF